MLAGHGLIAHQRLHSGFLTVSQPMCGAFGVIAQELFAGIDVFNHTETNCPWTYANYLAGPIATERGKCPILQTNASKLEAERCEQNAVLHNGL